MNMTADRCAEHSHHLEGFNISLRLSLCGPRGNFELTLPCHSSRQVGRGYDLGRTQEFNDNCKAKMRPGQAALTHTWKLF